MSLSESERFFCNYNRTMLLIVFSLANFNTGYTALAKADKRSDNVNWNFIPNVNLFLTTLSPSYARIRSQNNHTNASMNVSPTLYRHYTRRCKKFFIYQGFDYPSARYKENYEGVMQLSPMPPAMINNSLSLTRTINKISGHKITDLAIDDSTLDMNNNSNDLRNNSIFTDPMYFGTENLTVVTTQVGSTAHIPCSVHNIGDGVVSWIRKKDYHLLTVGLTAYSSDERFSAVHIKNSEDWTLQIKYVQSRDAGIYECQVSTHPPTSIFLHLHVVEARAEISGPLIRYLTPGSTLRLQCRILQNTELSDYIFWYNDNRMINYDTDRGINVSTEQDFQSSELIIARTRREHSGNYTCVASNAQSASVLVHIFKGDNPAAMYHGHVGSSTKSNEMHLNGILMLIVIIGIKKWRPFYV